MSGLAQGQRGGSGAIGSYSQSSKMKSAVWHVQRRRDGKTSFPEFPLVRRCRAGIGRIYDHERGLRQPFGVGLMPTERGLDMPASLFRRKIACIRLQAPAR